MGDPRASKIIPHDSLDTALVHLGPLVDVVIRGDGEGAISSPMPLPPDVALPSPPPVSVGPETEDLFRRVEQHLSRDDARRVTDIHVIRNNASIFLAFLPGVPGRVTVTMLDGLPAYVACTPETSRCAAHELPLLDARIVAGCLRVENLPHVDVCDQLPDGLIVSVPLPAGHNGEIEAWEIGSLDQSDEDATGVCSKVILPPT